MQLNHGNDQNSLPLVKTEPLPLLHCVFRFFPLNIYDYVHIVIYNRKKVQRTLLDI